MHASYMYTIKEDNTKTVITEDKLKKDKTFCEKTHITGLFTILDVNTTCIFKDNF